MGAFDEILKGAEEADKAVLQKYPALKASLEELDQIKPRYADADSRLTRWETWRKNNFDDTAGTTKTELALRTANTDLQTRVQTLEALSGADMSFDEILNGLKEKGYVTKADVEQTVAEKVKGVSTKEDIEKLGNNLDGAMQFVYAKSYNLGRRHEKEFGEELDMAEVLKYMGTNKISDPEAAYNQMVGKRRDDARVKALADLETKHKQAGEDARKVGEEAGKKQAAMGQGGRMPTDQTGQPLGHLERRAMDRAKKPAGDPAKSAEVPEGVKLGDQVLSSLGYQEMLKNREAGAA